MQNIAIELGLSETAFVSYNPDSDKYAIRYFSPKVEIPLCGHATLASAKVIFDQNPQVNTIEFLTIEQLTLIVQRIGEEIQMIFPIYNTTPQEAPDSLLKALGLKTITNSEYNKETNILLLEIDDVDVLQKLSPNFEALKKAHDTINGVLLTALSNKPDYDFESRYFWPWSGTNEDPVTGGTHTFLAKYWCDRLGKTKLSSFQCSARSGFMDLELKNNEELLITSNAQIVFKGELYL